MFILEQEKEFYTKLQRNDNFFFDIYFYRVKKNTIPVY